MASRALLNLKQATRRGPARHIRRLTHRHFHCPTHTRMVAHPTETAPQKRPSYATDSRGTTTLSRIIESAAKPQLVQKVVTQLLDSTHQPHNSENDYKQLVTELVAQLKTQLTENELLTCLTTLARDATDSPQLARELLATATSGNLFRLPLEALASAAEAAERLRDGPLLSRIYATAVAAHNASLPEPEESATKPQAEPQAEPQSTPHDNLLLKPRAAFARFSRTEGDTDTLVRIWEDCRRQELRVPAEFVADITMGLMEAERPAEAARILAEAATDGVSHATEPPRAFSAAVASVLSRLNVEMSGDGETGRFSSKTEFYATLWAVAETYASLVAQQDGAKAVVEQLAEFLNKHVEVLMADLPRDTAKPQFTPRSLTLAVALSGLAAADASLLSTSSLTVLGDLVAQLSDTRVTLPSLRHAELLETGAELTETLGAFNIYRLWTFQHKDEADEVFKMEISADEMEALLGELVEKVAQQSDILPMTVAKLRDRLVRLSAGRSYADAVAQERALRGAGFVPSGEALVALVTHSPGRDRTAADFLQGARADGAFIGAEVCTAVLQKYVVEAEEISAEAQQGGAGVGLETFLSERHVARMWQMIEYAEDERLRLPGELFYPFWNALRLLGAELPLEKWRSLPFRPKWGDAARVAQQMLDADQPGAVLALVGHLQAMHVPVGVAEAQAALQAAEKMAESGAAAAVEQAIATLAELGYDEEHPNRDIATGVKKLSHFEDLKKSEKGQNRGSDDPHSNHREAVAQPLPDFAPGTPRTERIRQYALAGHAAEASSELYAAIEAGETVTAVSVAQTILANATIGVDAALGVFNTAGAEVFKRRVAEEEAQVTEALLAALLANRERELAKVVMEKMKEQRPVADMAGARRLLKFYGEVLGEESVAQQEEKLWNRVAQMLTDLSG